MNMKVLGLDLSLTGSGIVLLEDGKIKIKQLIKSKPSGKKPIDELKRLLKIENEIRQIMIEEEPSLAVIEGMAYMASNTTSLVQLAGLNYIIRKMLHEHGIKFIVVAPTTLKKFSTSKGNCQKDLILLEVYKKYGEEFEENNQCDAYVLAKIGEVAFKDTFKNDEKELPKYQREVINLIKEQLYE